MSKEQIKRLIADQTDQDGLTETGINGVSLFRVTQTVPCVPAVYEPCVVAIVSGTKEAVFAGRRYLYDKRQYLCCPSPMPVKAGTPKASHTDPLYGVFVSLNHRMMTELIMEMAKADVSLTAPAGELRTQGIRLADWDASFTDALFRVLQLGNSQTDQAILGETRLRELHYAILKGAAGPFIRRAFGASNAIARSILYVSSNLDAPISIDALATRAGMSRAVFHRKFKQLTTMAPIQFVKSMRLNHAAMQIASGTPVNKAAMDVGYVSSSQFSREFKRAYGTTPRQWGETQKTVAGLNLS